MSRQSNQTQREIAEMKRLQRVWSEEDWADYGYDFCRGCETSQQPIDWCHLISQKRRPDLRAVRANQPRMCRGRCHELVELGKWDELKNGEECKAFVEENDPELAGLQELKRNRK